MFFQSDYNDLMPDHGAEDPGPQKTGAARLLEIAGDNCGSLMVVNVLFLLGCLPVVTAPLSLFALNRVIRRMVLDQPVRCLRDFGDSFRRDWRRAYPAFLLTAVPLGLAGGGAWFYLNCAASNLVFFLPFLVCSTIFLVALLSSGCLYGLLASGRSVKESLRPALLLGVARPLRTVPAALLCHGLVAAAVLLFPLSGAYLLLIGFSIPCLLGQFLLRTLLEQV